MFGLPSEEPRSYWRPELGLFTISPTTIGELTPAQIEVSYRWGSMILQRR